jgi:transcription antitermination factor NusG
LFPSYIFSRLDLYEHYHTIRYTRGVRRFVGDSTGSPYVVDESLIGIIRSKMQDGCISLEHPRIIKGEKVIILNGPFSGLTGLFMNELKPSERVVILLNTLQYQAKVEVPAELVARV